MAKKAKKKVVRKKAAPKRSASKRAKTSKRDLVQIILRDHKPLRKLIKTLKGEKADFAEKKEAFEEFAPLLLAHAKPEAQVMYMRMKQEDDLKVEGLEGDIEHDLAEQLCDELEITKDEDVFMAKVKVLAELVEHHIEEEEEDMLPDFQKQSTLEEREELGEKYEELRSEFI